MNKKLKVYPARAMVGCKFNEVVSYYDNIEQELGACGIITMSPLVGSEMIDEEGNIIAYDYPGNPILQPKAIFGRDFYLVRNSDVIYLNLTVGNPTRVTIGGVMELASGKTLNKHTIVSMESGNIHDHPFVRNAADIVFECHVDAIDYICELNG